jgi:hypothetical protein
MEKITRVGFDANASMILAWAFRSLTNLKDLALPQRREAREGVTGWLTRGYDGFRRLARCRTGEKSLVRPFFDADSCNVCGGSLAKISDP